MPFNDDLDQLKGRIPAEVKARYDQFKNGDCCAVHRGYDPAGLYAPDNEMDDLGDICYYYVEGQLYRSSTSEAWDDMDGPVDKEYLGLSYFLTADHIQDISNINGRIRNIREQMAQGKYLIHGQVVGVNRIPRPIIYNIETGVLQSEPDDEELMEIADLVRDSFQTAFNRDAWADEFITRNVWLSLQDDNRN